VCAAMRFAFIALAHDNREPRSHVVAQRHGAQKMAAADAELLSNRECRQESPRNQDAIAIQDENRPSRRNAPTSHL